MYRRSPIVRFSAVLMSALILLHSSAHAFARAGGTVTSPVPIHYQVSHSDSPMDSPQMLGLAPIVVGILAGVIAGGIIWGVQALVSGETCSEKYDDNMDTLNAHQSEISQATYDAAANTLTQMWLCCLQGKNWDTGTQQCDSSS